PPKTPIFPYTTLFRSHKGNDGGDTAQREGWYWFGTWIRQNVLKDPWTTPRALTFSDVLRLLEPAGDGVFCRHPSYSSYDKDWGLDRKSTRLNSSHRTI